MINYSLGHLPAEAIKYGAEEKWKATSVAVEWIVLLPNTGEIPGSNLGRDTCCPD
jgi:hypothetical protein